MSMAFEKVSLVLLPFPENVKEHMDRGNPADTAYLDFQKDFDKVPNERFVSKLRVQS